MILESSIALQLNASGSRPRQPVAVCTSDVFHLFPGQRIEIIYIPRPPSRIMGNAPKYCKLSRLKFDQSEKDLATAQDFPPLITTRFGTPSVLIYGAEPLPEETGANRVWGIRSPGNR